MRVLPLSSRARPGIPAALALVIALTVLLAGCGSAPTSTSGFVGGDGTLTQLPADQRPTAPVIAGTTLDGKTWSSDSAAGKVIVYNVWGSWCSPCRAEAPALVQASKRTAGQAVFVGLNTRDLDKAAPQAFVRSFGVPYVNLYDPDGALLLKFSGQLPASAIPSTLLVDPKGRVAARVIGETTEATLVGLVEDLAAGK
jgi:thiol-disulfide isomerase/thioredoxin